MNEIYKPIIGLEVHVQLKTKSKMFCSCPVEFGLAPNTNICPVCTGQPGTLPVVNKKAVELALKTALSLNCTISKNSVFARKNYFYPDLPKNYQISQYEEPVAVNGAITIELKETGINKKIGITRVHLEEDPGKLFHALGSRELDYSLVDYNRSGVPLIEIVSEPEIASAEEAYEYLSTLKKTLQYLDVSDCDMEKGSLRCDANISVMKTTDKQFGTRAEVKNMNSFKAVKEAINYEIARQINLLNEGGKIVQETRLWDERHEQTSSMRSKEEAHDYRYFPEPDLTPFIFTDDLLQSLQKEIPELPGKRKERFISEYKLSDYDSEVLVKEKPLADYFEKSLSYIKTESNLSAISKLLANWITTELLGKLNAENKTIEQSRVGPENMSALIGLIEKNTISGRTAKDVFNDMYLTGKKPTDIVKEKGLVQISDESEIIKVVEEAVRENPKAADEFKAGKKQALGAIMGAVMKKTSGKANPQIVNKLLQEILTK
ncbi:MAG: aspartyl/glutamyl-tRNA amidotransferase subunit B [Elusimicrobia bacterium RIFOXYA2_FULL_39_19]|nr:MAG: aspartyl/glutamyl-tRNA amidotransferase subunit B [Elusimicrobia bacterium RIFOXYA2_FULL_39_19]